MLMSSGPISQPMTVSRLIAPATVLACCVIPAIALLSRGWDAVPGTARSDFEFYFLPQLTFLARSLDHGFLPWWNPHLFCGYPVLEVQQSALFYPFRTVLLSFASPERALLLLCTAAAALAPIIGFSSLRAFLHVSPVGSAIGCCVFSMGAFVALRYHAGHLNYLSSIIWMPAAVLAATGMEWSHRGRRHMAVGAAALALMLLGGATQAVIVTVWAQGAAWLAMQTRTSWRRNLVVLAGGWVLAALVSLPQWLPTLIYLGHAQRATMSDQWTPDSVAALVALAEFVLRYPLGDGITSPHLQRRGVWDTSAYSGAFGLLLVLLALTAWTTRHIPRSQALRVGTALFALGWYLSAGGFLPGFAPFREPLKSLCLVSLGAGVLAAAGFDLLWTSPCRSPAFRRLAYAVGAVACLGSLSIMAAMRTNPGAIAHAALYLSDADHSAHPSVEAFRAQMARDPSVVTRPVLAAALWLCTGALLFLLLVGLSKRYHHLSVTLVALGLVSDLATAHWNAWVPGIRSGESGWPDETRQELERLLAETRKTGDDWRVYLPPAMSNSAQRVEDLAEPHGYDPLMPRMALARSYSTMLQIPADRRQALKALALGVRSALEEVDPSTPETVPQRSRQFRLREVMPQAGVATLTTGVIISDGRFEFGPLDGVHDWIEPDDRDRLPAGLLLTDTPPLEWPSLISGQVHRVRGRNPNILRYDIETSIPALLIVRHTWLPGWTARRDQQAATPPMRVNGWMMGVPVSSRTRTITLEYRPVGLTAGLWLGAFGCLATLGLLLARKSRLDST
jgi:hypothetical protein